MFLGVNLKKFVNDNYNDCGGMNGLLGEFTWELAKQYPYRKSMNDGKSGPFERYIYNSIYVNGDDCLLYKPLAYDIYEGTNEEGEHYWNQDPYKAEGRLKVKKQNYSATILNGVLKRLEDDLEKGCTFFKINDLHQWTDEKHFFTIRADLGLPWIPYKAVITR